MNYRLVIRILGRILILEAAAMLPALIVSMIYSDGAALSFMISAAILLAVGAAASFLVPHGGTSTMRPREGFLAVALSWVLLSLFGALPDILSGTIPNVLDAVFECVSGFTTTGATVLSNVEVLPRSIIFWRSLTQWLGGMGVLILALAVIPAGERGVFNLMRAEATGPSTERIVPRLRKSALILYGIYLALSAVETVFLLLGGMSVYDALVHMFATAGTGGFSSRDMSIGAYNSAYIEYTVGVFMLLFSLNFGVYFALITRRFKQMLSGTETKVFLSMIACAVLLITANLMVSGGYGAAGDAFRHAFFQVTSLGSSTGFSTVDYNLWPDFSRSILIILMVIGACAGSTSGGLKVIRVVMLFKSALREIKKILHPRSVNAVRVNGVAVPDKMLTGVMHYFAVYVFLVILATVLVSLNNKGLETSFTGVLSMISNTGHGFGLVGPMADFSSFSGLSKIVFMFCMLLGRLEIYPILLLLAPSAWRKT